MIIYLFIYFACLVFFMYMINSPQTLWVVHFSSQCVLTHQVIHQIFFSFETSFSLQSRLVALQACTRLPIDLLPSPSLWDSLHLSSVLIFCFLDSLAFFLSLCLHFAGTHSPVLPQKGGLGHKIFSSPLSEDVSIAPSPLTDNSTEYRLLGWKLWSVRILRTLCSIASQLPVLLLSSPMPFFFLILCTWYVFLLEAFRILSLSLVFWNWAVAYLGGFFFLINHLCCWLLGGIFIPLVLGLVLVSCLWSFPFCCFLHSLFLDLLLLDVAVPQLILPCSHLFSSVVHLFALLFCFLGYFLNFYFLILLLKSLCWLSLS